MTAGWVAGNVRAKAMARRRLGPDAARRLAACSSLPEAQRMQAATSYGRPGQQHGQTLAATQQAVADTILWDLRVLAGWLPRDGVDLLRALTCWFEIANVDDLLQAALLLAGERFATGRAIQPAVMDGALPLLGQAAAEAATLDRLRGCLPAQARWALAGVSSPDDLWQAEVAWWARVERDGRALLRSSGPDSGPVIGAVAVMAADARRICAALEIAARGEPLEAYDAVA
jgi:ATP synthase (C/AC39) subunit